MEDRVIVTGAPALDKIARTDKTQVRKEVREKLGVTEDETLISWFGQVGKATLESLQVLLEGLKVLESVLFDPMFRRELENKMQFWIPDGQAAKRVADKIIELSA